MVLDWLRWWRHGNHQIRACRSFSPAVPLANRWCWIGCAGGGTASIKSELVDRFLLPCPYQTDGAGSAALVAARQASNLRL
ncbi:hypothetical protein [Microseira wollei]|nr:hypothetical protein [Microseira wollei]